MSDTTPCAHHQFFGAREFCPDCGLSRAEVLVEACAPFLKDDETPAECIARNRQDASGCLTMLIDERRKVESLRSRLAAAEALLREEIREHHRFTQMTEYPSVTRMLLWHMDRKRRIDAHLAREGESHE